MTTIGQEKTINSDKYFFKLPYRHYNKKRQIQLKNMKNKYKTRQQKKSKILKEKNQKIDRLFAKIIFLILNNLG